MKIPFRVRRIYFDAACGADPDKIPENECPCETWEA